MNDFTTDLPPEYCQYHDEGCEFAQSCLNCHLPVCVDDEPGGKQRLLKRRLAAEMARLFTREGKNIGELAQIFGVSNRTVQRALKEAFGDPTGRNGCYSEPSEDSIHKKELDSSCTLQTRNDVRNEGV
jgi:AraC-like DNA-binding protein